MKACLPRDQTDPSSARTQRTRFNYGATPISIRKCIMFVKRELQKDGNYVVFLKTVRERYESYVSDAGEERFRLKDDRSLKKYVQPSLAASGIHLMLGAQKVGSFFCTSHKFIELAAKAKKPSTAPLALTPDAEGALYDNFASYLKSRQEDVLRSTWRLQEFIRAVPSRLWWRNIELLWGQQLKRRCKSISSLRDTRYNEQWPCNPLLCPDDMKELPSHEFTFVMSVYYTIERMVFLRSSRRIRGPITTSLSVVALTNTSVSYLSLLNRLGCATSYQLLDAWRKDVIAERKRSGPFQELEIGASVTVGIDNVNVRASHSLNVYGGTYNGFDGLAMQAVNSNPQFNFDAYCDWLARSDPVKLQPREISMPSKPLATSRNDFIKQNFPCRSTDPDIVGFKYLTVGLAALNQDRIASEDASNRKSFRRVILDALKGSTGGKARVEYVDVRGCNPNDEFEIIRLLESIEEHYNPFNSGRLTLIAVVGDQPIFKILFRLWMASVVTKSRLSRWMIPIPGGFHIDKQALIAMIKIFLSGSGLEEIARFTGLPRKKQESLITYAHYRKNRRIMSQYTAAQLLRLIEVLSEYDPDLRDYLRTVKEEIETELNLPIAERDRVYSDKSRATQMKSALPTGCELLVSESVSPKTVEMGKRIVETVKKLSEDSVNMKFFAEFQLLDMLVPWNAHNILTRKAMTSIVDKFWFSYVGLIHVTNKLNYQENMLMYAIVKASMPEAVRHVLFEKGHLVMSMHETSTENSVSQDDGIESRIIRDTKRMNTNDRKTIESSPPVAMALGRAQASVDKELMPVGRTGLMENENEADEPRKKDRESKTALNVLKMLDFLRSRRWLGEEHRRRLEVINVLREPWTVISCPNFFQQYIGAESTGRLAASLHLGAKFYDLFPSLTKEELKEHFADKPLKSVQDKWTKKFVFKTMADLETGSRVGSKRKRDRKDHMEKVMTKRMKTLFSVKRSLNNIICSRDEKFSANTVSTALAILEEAEKYDHLLTPKAFAYRSDLSTDEPFRGRDEFVSGLHSAMEKKGLIAQCGGFLGRDISQTAPPFAVAHLDITAEVKLSPSLKMQRTTVGEAVYDKVEKFVKPFVKSTTSRSVQELHIHLDVTEMLPPQHPYAKVEELPFQNSATTGFDDEEEPFQGICQTWTQMKQTWSSLVSNARNVTFLQRLHAVSAANAAVLMRSESNEDDPDNGDNSAECWGEGNLVVFLHGTSVAITRGAHKSSLSELDFMRIDEKVLVLNKSTELERYSRAGMSQIAEEVLGLESYASGCCWKVTKEGFKRYPAGDCAHGETQTRVIHSLQQVTIPRMANADMPYSEWSVLVRSCQPESAFITAVSSIQEDLSIFHQFEESFIDVRAMRLAFKAANIRAEDIVLLYAMSGCYLSAFTHHIPQKLFVDAFFGSGYLRRCLYSPEIMSMPAAGSEGWLMFEELVASAYILKYRNTVGADAPGLYDIMESDPGRTAPLYSEGMKWVSEVRKWVAEHIDVMTPNQLMPESSDIELQSRRAVWLLRYWKCADNYDCCRNSVGILKDESGYTPGGDLLFERPEDAKQREDIMKKVIQTCNCKGGCTSNRCGCKRKTPPSLCVLCKCENCQNCDKTATQELEPLRLSQNELSEDSEEEESSDDEDETDDDSILG